MCNLLYPDFSIDAAACNIHKADCIFTACYCSFAGEDRKLLNIQLSFTPLVTAGKVRKKTDRQEGWETIVQNVFLTEK